MRYAARLGLALFFGVGWTAERCAGTPIEAVGVAVPSGDFPASIRAPEDGFVASVAVSIGQEVQAGQKLLTFDAFTGEKTAFGQASAAVTAARDRRKRVGRLLEKHMATKPQLATARAAEAAAKAALDALRQQDAGHNRKTLAAPSPGFVSPILARPGDRAAAGMPLMSVMPKNFLVVRIEVDPGLGATLRPGQAAKLTPVDGGPAIDGAVLRVASVPDRDSGLIEAELSAPAAGITPGERLRVTIDSGGPANAATTKP